MLHVYFKRCEGEGCATDDELAEWMRNVFVVRYSMEQRYKKERYYPEEVIESTYTPIWDQFDIYAPLQVIELQKQTLVSHEQRFLFGEMHQAEFVT